MEVSSGIGRCAVFLDNDWGKELSGFEITDIEVKNDSSMILKPVETGRVKFDNKVLNPIEIKVKGFVSSSNFESVFQHLDEMASNRSWSFYSIVSKANAYKNLVLKTEIHSDETEKFDVNVVVLNFVEAIQYDENGTQIESASYVEDDDMIKFGVVQQQKFSSKYAYFYTGALPDVESLMFDSNNAKFTQEDEYRKVSKFRSNPSKYVRK